MTTRTLTVSLTSEDKGLAKGLDQASKGVGSFEKKVEKASKGSVSKFETRVGSLTDGLGKLGLAMGAAQAFQAFSKFVGDAITSASELEQSIGGVQAVFGELSDTILDASEGAAQAVGLSENAYNQLAARLGGQLQTFGFTLDETTGKTQDLIAVGADLAATYGGTVAEAVEAISSLLRGESNPIERYAIAINQTSINAKAMALGLADNTREVDFNAKAVAALDLLYEQSARSQGQFAREADTAAGAQERLRAELENMKAEIGTELLPVWIELVDAAKDLAPAVKGIATEAAAAVSVFGNLIQTMKDFAELADDFGIDVGIDAGPEQLDALYNQAIKAESGLSAAERAMLLFSRAISKVSIPARVMLGNLDKATEGLVRQERVHKTARIAAENYTDAVRDGVTGYDRLVPAAEDADRALFNVAQGFGKVEDATLDNLEASDNYAGSLGDGLIPKLLEAQEAAGHLHDELRKQSDPLFAAIDAWDGYLAAIEAANEVKMDGEIVVEAEGVVSAQEELDLLREKLDFNAALGALGSNYEEIMTALELATGKPRSEVEALLEELELLDGQTFTTTVETLFTSKGQPPASNKGIEFRASGGSVVANRPYIVGENGPELMVPGSSGHVFPNDTLRSAEQSTASSGGVHIGSVVVYAQPGETVNRATIRELSRELRIFDGGQGRPI